MNQIRVTAISLILFLFSQIGISQSCYVKLFDATGIDISDYQVDLENAACQLRASFPVQYQAQFKVYDFGFYSLNEYMQGGFKAIWDQQVQDVRNLSSYYLLFGRQLPDSKGNVKLWIATKLPNQSSGCNDKEEEIIATLEDKYNPVDNPFKFPHYEIEIMKELSVLKNCEDCLNQVDDDGDGFIDCKDLDCAIGSNTIQAKEKNRKKSPLLCPTPTSAEILCMRDYYTELNLIGCKGTESALDFCRALEDLRTLNLPQQSEYTKLIQYIETVRNMACNRCLDYELHCEFLDTWLYLINNSTNVTTGEIYKMAVWCKSLRDEILARHLLQFGSDLLVALEIATWEFDLFATQRFFSAVPKRARNYGMRKITAKIFSPVSSFSSLLYAQKFGINTYDDLGKIFRDMGWTRSGKNVEFHHLIEQRFLNTPGVKEWLGPKTNKWQCIVVGKGMIEHTPKFTRPWKTLIGYGNTAGSLGVTTSTAKLSHIKEAAKIVYRDYPEILKVLGL